ALKKAVSSKEAPLGSPRLPGCFMRRSHVFRRLAKWWNAPRRQRSRGQRHFSALRIEPLDHRLLLTALTIAQENQLPGNTIDQWFYNATASTNIEGYATQMSVNHGQS